ncbi:hypothetical protein [Antarcticirhabdus aurantiaca]|uniref:Uncharacterized protein n=1 Tax=Antarcticirhabdus aurantiaca TaxID=2606717 RepID=A0ACD4NH46_9HYPH|nr:hypothetical protein [Antarcticirhabdus aurantiaca]WAJ26127.1 hypothetical protein OXU80_14515 [Jeongeuplla avenae]
MTAATRARRLLPLGGVLLVALASAGCLSDGEQRRADLYQDAGTCADFGARPGSHAHTQCMLRQQERRDNEQILALERARISSETARNNLEMLETIRARRRED